HDLLRASQRLVAAPTWLGPWTARCWRGGTGGIGRLVCPECPWGGTAPSRSRVTRTRCADPHPAVVSAALWPDHGQLWLRRARWHLRPAVGAGSPDWSGSGRTHPSVSARDH